MADVHVIEDGWDSRAFLVDGGWLDREPRRDEVRERLLAETRLMPWLAPQLPLPVPRPEVIRQEPLRVRHRFLRGDAAIALTDEQGALLGRFFKALHSADAGRAVDLGVIDADVARAELTATLDRFRVEVLPRLPEDLRHGAADLLERLARPLDSPALVHGDVGPQHILVADGKISGVIDWTDAHLGDPAMDIAWPVNASGAGDAVAAAYGADSISLARARDWHLLGPWHEVTYGLDTSAPALVESGMFGVRSRLNSL